jgi:hypothetical protein
MPETRRSASVSRAAVTCVPVGSSVLVSSDHFPGQAARKTRTALRRHMAEMSNMGIKYCFWLESLARPLDAITARESILLIRWPVDPYPSVS